MERVLLILLFFLCSVFGEQRFVTLNNEVVHVKPESVYVFLDFECPISKRYTSELNEIYKLAKLKKLGFYGVVSNSHMSWNEAVKFAKPFKVDFPLIFDASGTLANRYKPTTVPHAYVSRHHKILYSGRINNLFADIGKKRARATEHDLRNAIIAVAKGEKPKVSKTEPVGCVFEKEDKPKITYNRNIAPLIAANCADCHRPNDIGPFSLTDYQKVKRKAKTSSRAIDKKLMPPWKANSEVPILTYSPVASAYKSVTRCTNSSQAFCCIA